MTKQPLLSAGFGRRLQLATTLFVVLYMTVIGGSFSATVVFRAQLLNAIGGSALALVWLVWRVRQKQPLATTGLEIPLGLYVAAQWAAAAASPEPRLSLEQAASVSAWTLAFIILCDLLAGGWPRAFIENALLAAVVLIAGQAFWEVVTWFAAWAALGMLPAVAFRLTGFLGHPNLTAAALNLLTPLVLVRTVRSKGWIPRTLWGLLLIIMAIDAYFSSSRSGWIGLGVLLVSLGALSTLSNPARARQWLQTAGQHVRSLHWIVQAAAGLACAAILAGGAYLLWRETLHGSHPEFTTSRQYIWGPAWQNFVGHPLTGGGPGLYTWFYPLYSSIPPDWLAPHAHSIFFQTVSDSGVLGLLSGAILIGVGTWLLLSRWRRGPDRLAAAGFAAGCAGWFVHHQFDYLFGTPAFTFLFAAFIALALAPEETKSVRRGLPPAVPGVALAILVGCNAYFLRAAAANDAALQKATLNDWRAAAAGFEQAAEDDPGLSLYTESAAYAYARAGDLSTAISTFENAKPQDPYWSVLPATLGVLRSDAGSLSEAFASAPHSDLFALNLGVVEERSGDLAAAKASYLQVMRLRPAAADALFWQANDFRRQVVKDWQREAPPPSTLDMAQGALDARQPERAMALFEQARVEAPFSNLPYLGLARAAWAAGDETLAWRNYQVARLIPIVYPTDMLPLLLFEGDWNAAHGNRQAAVQAYLTSFSMFNDYTSDGPGTYGYPQRAWYVFHRNAPASNLVPSFARADITNGLDERFANLAVWLLEDGQRDTACLVAARVASEAPTSRTAQFYASKCTS